MEHRQRLIPYAEAFVGKLVQELTSFETVPNTYIRDVTYSPNGDVQYYLQGYQITDTESHPEWRNLIKGRFTKDLGGPFFSQKWESKVHSLGSASMSWIEGQDPSWPDGRRKITITYSGPILPMNPGLMEWPSVIRSSDDSLDEYGTHAIAQCSPSKPSVDLATALGEFFKDGIPKIIGGTLTEWRALSTSDRRKAIGDEYLNVEFGWKPLMNDLRDFCRNVGRTGSNFENYESNSRKVVRRRYNFPEEKKTSVTLVREGTSPWYSPSISSFDEPPSSPRGQVWRTDEVTTRRWFSGAFTYFVPPPNTGVRNEIARGFQYARKTLGLSLTPDTIWNLAPWSWAVDWFGSTGDFLSNWTDWAIDGQVLLYGYIMEHKIHKRTYTYLGPTGLVGIPRPADVIYVVETKVRRPATPYGFGFRWEDMSNRQKAIIAALGISRGK
jgi:hypothetical protein